MVLVGNAGIVDYNARLGWGEAFSRASSNLIRALRARFDEYVLLFGKLIKGATRMLHLGRNSLRILSSPEMLAGRP